MKFKDCCFENVPLKELALPTPFCLTRRSSETEKNVKFKDCCFENVPLSLESQFRERCCRCSVLQVSTLEVTRYMQLYVDTSMFFNFCLFVFVF